MSGELSMDQVLINKLNEVLEVNLENELFGVKELTEALGISRAQLHRKINKFTGKSTSQFIREFRLEKAMQMLQRNVATASEIAYRVGFNSPTYFNTSFREYYGYPPGEVKFRNPMVIENDKLSKNLELIDDSQVIKEAPSPKKFLLTKRMVWVNTFFIVLLGVVSYNLYQNYKDTPAEELANKERQGKSIAILPFKNLSNDVDNQYFADGVSGSIQNNLNKISDLTVIPLLSMEKYRNATLTASEIANEVNVQYILEGSVQKYGDSIRIIINLVDTKNNEQLQSYVYDREYKNIFNIQSKIAVEIAKKLHITIDSEKLETIQKPPTENLEAYNLYLKGRFFWHRRTVEDINKSIQYFNQSIELDSTYTLAYAGLADSYCVMPWYIAVKNKDSVYNLAIKYAKKALSLDKNNGQAHATIGSVLCSRDWNWEASEKELMLAIQLNPNYATAHENYSELLEILGRAKEARREIDIAISLNPNSYRMTLNSARLYYKDGLYKKGIIEANKAKELNNKNAEPYRIIMNCYKYMGKDDEAIAEWNEWEKINPNIELNKGQRDAFKKSGMKGFWKYLTKDFVKTGQAYENPLIAGINLAYLGENEKALEWLELAYEQRNPGIIFIKSTHDLKNLRNEPRFLALLKKMNLGNYEQ